MEQLSKSKKLARIEVLFVVLVCIFLLGILPLACRKSRSIESQMTCGVNLSSIGKAIQIYATDYDGEFPRAGSETTAWSKLVPNWLADDRYTAYGINPPDGSGGICSITSSFYLLVKYAGVLPKTFICPGDKGTTEFKPADYDVGNKELADLWDFGAEPREHCSFSYHMPYGLFTLTSSSDPGMAVAADPNPWIDSPSIKGKDPSLMGLYEPTRSKEKYKIGNAITHRAEGQNVLFMGGHTGFEEIPFCGINEDNIYTFWDGGDIRRGGLPIPGASEAADRLDSFLVNDGNPPGVPIGVTNPESLFKERNR
jgi:hypothetical protein